MELTSRMKMARFQTFWIQMQKNKPLDENCKTGQTSGTKMAFYIFFSFQKINKKRLAHQPNLLRFAMYLTTTNLTHYTTHPSCPLYF
ncbi:hypothetical protein Hanom_Chr09g00765061 [Helianthus anomalus]